MSNEDEPRSEIELVSDGDGLAVIGDPLAVERFLSAAGVASRDLNLAHAFGGALNVGSAAAKGGSEVAASAGRWVKLTEESAKALKLGNAMKGSSDSVSRAIVTTSKGKITNILEFVKPGTVGSMLTNPAMLAGAAGIMAQLAMQQTMQEITDYLAVIDEKVDDILRAQKDNALARMIGVGLVIDDAMLKREHVGRVSEVTWSSLHGAAQTIAETQSYALRRLDALAEKLEKKSRVGDIAEVAKDAEREVEEWLAVLARCFQLQDGLAVLELDRVLDSTPNDLDRHREAIQAGRAKRRDLIAKSTERLLARMDAAAVTANTKVLFHPLKPGEVVRSSNEVGAAVLVFHETLGISDTRVTLEKKRWKIAAIEARDATVEAGAAGVQTAGRLGARGAKVVASFSVDVAHNAKDMAGKVSSTIASKMRRRDREEPSDADAS
ncbi:hypothetical protein IT882_05710 [Microbacterium schleiferi]|uniref:Uncharacterized protein n=1 Tax=Microbacterium schleiferi TaxID=69362 RepID=A0A7S8RI93_9MICO|nr:hypothetical protein [Microbacterium schleiferi]QPE05512.1 hypothetical protein IT882_05710 [Microbacterium schleiferi]